MARMTDAEKESLKQAADTAKAVLVRLYEERETLGRRIGSMEAVVAAYEASQGKRDKAPNPDPDGPPSPPKHRRARKGQVATEIETVLLEKELGLREIGDAIRQKFGTDYARNTLYTALHREQTKFQRVGRKWRINPLVVMPKAV